MRRRNSESSDWLLLLPTAAITLAIPVLGWFFWERLDAGFKLGGAVLFLVLAQCLGGWVILKKRDQWWRECAALFAADAFAFMLIALVQNYQIPGSLVIFLTALTALWIPLVYLFGATILSGMISGGIVWLTLLPDGFWHALVLTVLIFPYLRWQDCRRATMWSAQLARIFWIGVLLALTICGMEHCTFVISCFVWSTLGLLFFVEGLQNRRLSCANLLLPTGVLALAGFLLAALNPDFWQIESCCVWRGNDPNIELITLGSSALFYLWFCVRALFRRQNPLYIAALFVPPLPFLMLLLGSLGIAPFWAVIAYLVVTGIWFLTSQICKKAEES